MKYKILIVDDEVAYLRLLERLFRRDYEVMRAESAEEALALLRIETFDLFLLDYTLPRMSGVELCARIRQTDLETPIMFFTEMAHLRDRQSAMKAGATEYLIKSDDWDKLHETVLKLIHEK